jgi:aldose 1-epimerase
MAAPADTITLRDEHWNVVVAPVLGGRLLAGEYDGIPMLQPTLQADPAGAGASPSCYFPLIPYSNRIENGLFRFRGISVQASANVAGSPHAMHGHGWQRAWDVDDCTATGCALSYVHAPAPDWPWRYRGRQTVAISEDELRITLAIENLESGAMPCGLGFHPFLPAGDGARLRMRAATVWDGIAGGFPTRRIEAQGTLDFRGGPCVVDRQGIDHCFEGWNRRATVSYEGTPSRTLLVSCDSTRSVIVYIPAGADYFCVEPVTHAVNAMNLEDAGWWILEPQETRHVTMSIRCGIRARGSPPRHRRTSSRNP